MYLFIHDIHINQSGSRVVYVHLMDEKRISSETLDREFVFEEKN